MYDGISLWEVWHWEAIGRLRLDRTRPGGRWLIATDNTPVEAPVDWLRDLRAEINALLDTNKERGQRAEAQARREALVAPEANRSPLPPSEPFPSDDGGLGTRTASSTL